MTDAFVQLPPDSTGSKIDTESLTVSANTVMRERHQVAGATDVAIAVVTNATPGASDYGLVVRGAGVFSVDDNGTTLSVDDGGGALTVDGSVSIAAALPAGTNNIGDVDVLTVPHQATEDAAHASGAIGAFVLAVRNDGASALTSTDGDYSPFAVDSAGRIGIADLGGVISVDDGGSSLTVDVGTALPAGANKVGSVNRELEPAISGTVTAVKFASVDVATSGDNTIVAAVASTKLRVLAYTLVASGGANTCTWKSATAGAVTGGMGFAANGGASAECDHGLFETTAGEALVLNLSAATSVDGHITYIEV